jgi:FAD/FMN-containing dehydrogenase
LASLVATFKVTDTLRHYKTTSNVELHIGGGHGPLATLHGMAADQALAFEVITADGVFRRANPVENADLFWALKGGGPSTFAAIVSLTVKTFPETPSAGVVFRINGTHTNDTEVFWKGKLTPTPKL